MKWLAALVAFCWVFSVGQSLAAGIADCRSGNEKATAIAAYLLGGAENLPGKQKRVEKYPDLNKFACKVPVGKGRTATLVIYEHKRGPVAGGYYSLYGDLPDDAIILK